MLRQISNLFAIVALVTLPIALSACKKGKRGAAGHKTVETARAETATSKPKIVEDPTIKPPPADGVTPVTASRLRRGITGAPSKWEGKQVTVKGLYLNTSMTMRSGKHQTTVTIVDKVSNLETSVSCSLKKDAKAPDLFQGTPLIAKGEVSGALVGLANCSVEVPKKEPAKPDKQPTTPAGKKQPAKPSK
jgi:hypothetical protein